MRALSKCLVLLGAPLLFAAAFQCSGSTQAIGNPDASAESGSGSSGSTSGSSSSSSSGASSSSSGGSSTSSGGSSSGAIDASTSGGPEAGAPDSGGGPCGKSGDCPRGLTCCGTACVDLTNDPFNCGGCGTACSGDTSMCNGSKCTAPTCDPKCTPSQQCCEVDGPGPTQSPRCFDSPTCPVGCPLCG